MVAASAPARQSRKDGAVAGAGYETGYASRKKVKLLEYKFLF